MLAVALGLCGFLVVIVHHQMFWQGMRAGYRMRQQCIAAIHAKVRAAAAMRSHTTHVHTCMHTHADAHARNS